MKACNFKSLKRPITMLHAEPRHEKTCFAVCKQLRRRSACTSRSLISIFVVHCLDTIISLVSIFKISSLYVAYVATQAVLCLSWSQSPKTGFLMHAM